MLHVSRQVGASNDAKTRLLKLRNPWGLKEWDGPWGDGKEEWNTATGKKAKAELGVTFAEDGTFWMGWDEFQASARTVDRILISYAKQLTERVGLVTFLHRRTSTRSTCAASSTKSPGPSSAAAACPRRRGTGAPLLLFAHSRTHVHL